jgi:CRISPR-associated exonuclease Cas4
MAHEINPHQENPFLELGRLIHEESYSREKKEFETVGLKIDIIGKKDGKLLVGEVKKSDRFLKSATMQLSFYLYRLKQMGITAQGELLIPKAKTRIPVALKDENQKEIEFAISEISELIKKLNPPFPQKISFCKNCAYREFCWI